MNVRASNILHKCIYDQEESFQNKLKINERCENKNGNFKRDIYRMGEYLLIY